MRIFVIIPCYNEAGIIRQTVLQVLDANYEVIVVDDGSEEDILPQIKDLPILYLKHAVNLGQGAALQTGMEYALAQGADIVVHFDADGQHQANDIQQLLTPILQEEADVVLGSRFLKPEHTQKIPTFRKFVLQIARTINFLFTGLWLTDAHNGFRALNKKALNSISITENRMAHATEILKQIKDSKLRYRECPTQIIYSAYAKQKGQSSWNAINIFIDLLLNRVS